MDIDLSKSLKRCLSVPIINKIDSNKTAANNSNHTPRKDNNLSFSSDKMSSTTIPQVGSNPPSREVSPAPIINIFSSMRSRRYSGSFSPLGAGGPPRLTPRVSQLRQEECLDINSREVNHEREVHSTMQISQSWEDLTLVAENWSYKSEDVNNPLQVALPSGMSTCSSPSPTSSRAGLRLPYGLSPSPTRRTFQTRRSMSPIAMRPSQLGPVKRKFELDDSNWGSYSSQPLKKIFSDSRGSSPVCQSPSSICPSPDSGTYEGRITPKLFISKLCTTNTNNFSSFCSSGMGLSPGIDGGIDLQSNASSSSSPANTLSSSLSTCEPMSIVQFDNLSNENMKNSQDFKSTTSSSLSDNDDDNINMMNTVKAKANNLTKHNDANVCSEPQNFMNQLPITPPPTQVTQNISVESCDLQELCKANLEHKSDKFCVNHDVKILSDITSNTKNLSDDTNNINPIPNVQSTSTNSTTDKESQNLI